MLKRTITVLVITLIAGLLGFGGVAGTAIFIISSLVGRPEDLNAFSDETGSQLRAASPLLARAGESSQRKRELRHECSRW